VTTIRDHIGDALAAALATVPDVAEIDIEPDGDPTRFDALALYDGGHQVVEREAGLIRCRGTWTIEGYVTGGSGAIARAARNRLHAAAVAAIMADDTLGGLVELVEPEDLRLTTATLASSRRLMFAQDIAIEFTMLRTNPALSG
jgi:hypothetical protein